MLKTTIILQKDIPNLGLAGEIREVSPGYARNYLIPRRLASLATERNRKTWESQKDKLEEDRKGKLAAAQELAKKVQETVCLLNIRAGKDGKLFGSVTAAEVSRFFNEKGIPLDRRWVDLREPIRTTGEFVGGARLHPQVRASFKIQVLPVA